MSSVGKIQRRGTNFYSIVLQEGVASGTVSRAQQRQLLLAQWGASLCAWSMLVASPPALEALTRLLLGKRGWAPRQNRPLGVLLELEGGC